MNLQLEHSPDHTTAAVSFPSPTQPTQPSPRAEQHIPTPYDSPLHVVHSHGSDLRVKWTPTEVIQSRKHVKENGNSEVSTAGATKGTASEVPVISTAEENISTAGRTVTYIRRSEEEKDKGKDKGEQKKQ
ncbi:hypothetical protein Tco_1138471 [Tanacetum coccineum]